MEDAYFKRADVDRWMKQLNAAKPEKVHRNMRSQRQSMIKQLRGSVQINIEPLRTANKKKELQEGFQGCVSKGIASKKTKSKQNKKLDTAKKAQNEIEKEHHHVPLSNNEKLDSSQHKNNISIDLNCHDNSSNAIQKKACKCCELANEDLPSVNSDTLRFGIASDETPDSLYENDFANAETRESLDENDVDLTSLNSDALRLSNGSVETPQSLIENNVAKSSKLATENLASLNSDASRVATPKLLDEGYVEKLSQTETENLPSQNSYAPQFIKASVDTTESLDKNDVGKHSTLATENLASLNSDAAQFSNGSVETTESINANDAARCDVSVVRLESVDNKINNGNLIKLNLLLPQFHIKDSLQLSIDLRDSVSTTSFSQSFVKGQVKIKPKVIEKIKPGKLKRSISPKSALQIDNAVQHHNFAVNKNAQEFLSIDTQQQHSSGCNNLSANSVENVPVTKSKRGRKKGGKNKKKKIEDKSEIAKYVEIFSENCTELSDFSATAVAPNIIKDYSYEEINPNWINNALQQNYVLDDVRDYRTTDQPLQNNQLMANTPLLPHAENTDANNMIKYISLPNNSLTENDEIVPVASIPTLTFEREGIQTDDRVVNNIPLQTSVSTATSSSVFAQIEHSTPLSVIGRSFKTNSSEYEQAITPIALTNMPLHLSKSNDDYQYVYDRSMSYKSVINNDCQMYQQSEHFNENVSTSQMLETMPLLSNPSINSINEQTDEFFDKLLAINDGNLEDENNSGEKIDIEGHQLNVNKMHSINIDINNRNDSGNNNNFSYSEEDFVLNSFDRLFDIPKKLPESEYTTTLTQNLKKSKSEVKIIRVEEISKRSLVESDSNCSASNLLELPIVATEMHANAIKTPAPTAETPSSTISGNSQNLNLEKNCDREIEAMFADFVDSCASTSSPLRESFYGNEEIPAKKPRLEKTIATTTTRMVSNPSSPCTSFNDSPKPKPKMTSVRRFAICINSCMEQTDETTFCVISGDSFDDQVTVPDSGCECSLNDALNIKPTPDQNKKHEDLNSETQIKENNNGVNSIKLGQHKNVNDVEQKFVDTDDDVISLETSFCDSDSENNLSRVTAEKPNTAKAAPKFKEKVAPATTTHNHIAYDGTTDANVARELSITVNNKSYDSKHAETIKQIPVANHAETSVVDSRNNRHLKKKITETEGQKMSTFKRLGNIANNSHNESNISLPQPITTNPQISNNIQVASMLTTTTTTTKTLTISNANSEQMTTKETARIFGVTCLGCLAEQCQLKQTASLAHTSTITDPHPQLVKHRLSMLSAIKLEQAYKLMFSYRRTYYLYFDTFREIYTQKHNTPKLLCMIDDCRRWNDTSCVLHFYYICKGLLQSGVNCVNTCSQILQGRNRNQSHAIIDKLVEIISEMDWRLYTGYVEQFLDIPHYHFHAKPLIKMAPYTRVLQFAHILFKCMLKAHRDELQIIRESTILCAILDKIKKQHD